MPTRGHRGNAFGPGAAGQTVPCIPCSLDLTLEVELDWFQNGTDATEARPMMATLTLKNIPDELYDHLRQSAAEARRSLNSEILFRLEASLRSIRGNCWPARGPCADRWVIQ
jgi:hypothetical protein